ncbi:MAG: hypothetical protein PHP37_03310, partial [Patescibacteria group bacterium]|nr:hypothetical protein [Patescibacteria group bacterium]
MKKKEKAGGNLISDVKGPEPVFNIHRMPKGYKIGRFEGEKSNLNKKNDTDFIPSKKHQHNKKIGGVIIFFGVIIVLVLGYIVFSYLSNPNFKLSQIFNFSNKNSLEKQNNIDIVNNVKVEDIFKEEDSIIIDGVETDIIDEAVEEEVIDPLLSTSTEEVVEEPAFDDFDYLFVDNDGDGLSDSEEIILGTDFFEVDSDGDSYSDLTEALNLYDPIGNGRLVTNPNISKYQNNTFSYNILYPVLWDKNVLSDESSVIFSINSNSFIQVLVEENVSRANIKNWYTSRFFSLVEEERFVENDNWEG